MDLDRRSFLRALGAGSVVMALGGSRAVGARGGIGGDPGPLGPPDALGIRTPAGAGFMAREVARAGEPVAGTGYRWHPAPDGGATFATDDGGWIYVSNSEVPLYGGASAVRFDATGEIVDATQILSGTSGNCSGGPTPWGTWLSCEEHDQGRVWECDPTGQQAARALDGLGRCFHEAAAVDPDTGIVYLTEDRRDGLLYRWVPASFAPGGRVSFDDGRLEAALVDATGHTKWLGVPDGPEGSELRSRVDATSFARGEGAWFEHGRLRFCTTADARVWELDAATSDLRVLHQGGTGSPLDGPDNITGAPGGWSAVAEDGGDLQVLIVSASGAWPLLQITGDAHVGSELTGIAFDPHGTRLYVSSQRGYGRGVTYEISGPFAEALGVDPSVAPATSGTTTTPGTGGSRPSTSLPAAGTPGVPVVAVGAAGAAAVGFLGAMGAAAWKLRRRDGSIS